MLGSSLAVKLEAYTRGVLVLVIKAVVRGCASST